jgi:predicted RND superfamily exporter protein
LQAEILAIKVWLEALHSIIKELHAWIIFVSLEFMTAILHRWIAWRWALLAFAAVLAVACWRPAQQLVFDQSIESMFAPHDPLLPAWREFKQLFGGQEVALAAYEEADGLTSENFGRLQTLTKELQAAVPGVHVQSLATIPLGERVLDPHARDIRLRELLTGYLLSSDRKTVAVVCMLPAHHEAIVKAENAPAPGKLTPSQQRAADIDALRKVVEQYPRGTLAGEPAMIVDGFRFLELDGLRLERVSTALVLLTLLISFRSLRWVIIPLLLVQLTLLVTRALLAVTGYQLSMVSSMLAAMITIVGVATIAHLIARYQAELAAGRTPRAALAEAVRVLWWPICGAIATDIIGFGALLLSHVGPIRDFGLMTALGSFLVIPCGTLLIPAIALAAAQPRPALPGAPPPRLGRALVGLWRMIERWPGQWLTGIVLVGAVAVWYSLGLRVETDFTKNFRDDSPIVRSYDFVESRLGGAGVWDVLVPVPAELDLATLAKLRGLEKDLRAIQVHGENGEEPGLTKVLSLADVLDAVSPADLTGDGFFARGALATTLNVMQTQLPDLYGSLDAVEPAADGRPSQRWLRIMLRAKERMSAEAKSQIIDQVRRLAAEHFPGPPPAKVTGFYVLLANLIQSLSADQWLTFGAAAGGIGLLLLVTLRSVRLALIALVPNALSIFLMTGALGLGGVRANMGTIMIAAVSMGLSVDASIHYLVAYRRLRRAGSSVVAALEAVQQETGTAMVFATLSLVVGFSAMAASEFVPTIYFGVLSSVTMIGGMLGNLIVLPLLVYLTERERQTLPAAT